MAEETFGERVVPLHPPCAGASAQKRLLLLAGTLTPTNAELLASARSYFKSVRWVRGEQLTSHARAGDVVLARLDVRRSLDGVEAGIWELQTLDGLEDEITILNSPGALLVCHDKLDTALTLAAALVPHPRTSCVETPSQLTDLAPPVVVKPRFGSWGADVHLCRSELDLRRCFSRIRLHGWFQRQGALVQELIPPRGKDLRVIVAAGTVVGAIERVAARGEWRTNVAVGGVRRRITTVPPAAADLAVRAAAAAGTDLAGVDLLPLPNGGWTVLELNGAVDFTQAYALEDANIYAGALSRLVLASDGDWLSRNRSSYSEDALEAASQRARDDEA